MDSVTGIITVADGTQLNFESASSHNITVRATDTGGLSYNESFTITISDVNEGPTAAADSFTGRQLKALIVPAGLVTANDFDIDGDSISVVVVNAPTSGTIQLNSDGSFSYTPKNSFSGLDSFTYYVTDGSLSSNLATVEIDVRIAVSGVDTDTESVLDSFVAGTTITDSETAAAETSAAGPDQNATGANATARINRTGDQTTGEEILDGQVAQETALQIMRRLSGQMAITIFLDEVPENELPDQSNRSSRSDESDQQERKNGSSNFLFERVVTENPFFLHISGNSTAKIDTTDRQEEVFPEMMFDKIVVGSTVAVSASMSVGYAIWLLSSRLYVFAHNNLRIILT